MKTLMLLRHAKSSWKDESLDDRERPLNKRGKKTAPRMGRLVRELGLVPDRILSSTAERARQTAQAFARAAGCEKAIELDAALYLATAGEILRKAQTFPDESVGRLMLVGHNPGMEELVNRLSSSAPREAFPTAALAVFELGIESWCELALGVPTKRLHLFRPKELE